MKNKTTKDENRPVQSRSLNLAISSRQDSLVIQQQPRILFPKNPSIVHLSRWKRLPFPAGVAVFIIVPRNLTFSGQRLIPAAHKAALGARRRKIGRGGVGGVGKGSLNASYEPEHGLIGVYVDDLKFVPFPRGGPPSLSSSAVTVSGVPGADFLQFPGSRSCGDTLVSRNVNATLVINRCAPCTITNKTTGRSYFQPAELEGRRPASRLLSAITPAINAFNYCTVR